MTDMRTIPSSDKGSYSYLREDMVFAYDRLEKLDELLYYTKPTIFSRGIRITIYTKYEWPELSSYPMDGEETLMSRILSSDEEVSSQAIRELKTLVEKSRRRQIIFEISLIVAALIVVVLVIVFFKKFRQKRLYRKYLKMHSETSE